MDAKRARPWPWEREAWVSGRALAEEYPQTQAQRCWGHKRANVLDKLPKTLQPAAKDKIHQMYLAPTKESAGKAFDAFLELYDAKYPKACECLRKDKDVLFTC